MLGLKERDQLELFITNSLRQLIPDDHVLARVDRVLDLAPLAADRAGSQHRCTSGTESPAKAT